MFVEVFQGQVSDATEMRAAFDRWAREVAPGQSGLLGATAGVTDDGRYVGVVRFESEEAGRRSTPELEQWWEETSKLFTGEIMVRESREVVVDVSGDPDTAGFVQVIQGRTSDPARMGELLDPGSAAQWAAFRPDVLGSLSVELDDAAYALVIYFTSEEAAREGERKEPPPELKAEMEEMDALTVGEPEYFDLRKPWLYSPR
jgi:hypothetical protein